MGAGRPPVLNPDIEKQIATCLIARAQIGFPCDKEELKKLVSEYVKANDIPNPFHNSLPGEDWYQSFMRRNSNISLKKPEHLQKCRKTARDPAIVYDFYSKLEEVYNKHDLKGADNAKFVFNCDESGFANDPSRLRALGEKGKALCRISGGSGRESTTVLICVSADGFFLPPLIVFKGAAVQARWTSAESYPGTRYAASSNGWMEEPQFFYWFKDCFIPHVNSIRNNNHEQAAVLMYDGHASHYSIRIIQEAMNNKIELVRFPSHLTDRIQPLDKCVFGPIKVKWDKKLVQYGKTQVGQGTGRLSKAQFAVFLGEVLRESLLSKNIISGFVSTGTYPIDPAKFPENLFDPVDLQKYKHAKRCTSTEIEKTNNLPQNNIEHQTPSTSTENTEKNTVLVSNTNMWNSQPSTSSSDTQELVMHSTPTKTIISASRIEDCLSPEVQNVAMDLSTRITEPSPMKPLNNPRTVVEIFSSVLEKKNQAQKPDTNKNKSTVVRRLTQFSYGEVLTSEEVMKRLIEAEEKKDKKNSLAKKRTQKNTDNVKKTKKSRELEEVNPSQVDKSKDIYEDNTDDDTEEQFIIEMEMENTPETKPGCLAEAQQSVLGKMTALKVCNNS
ncbi:uncharacterized protein LOC116159312 [Photinus pyralis]|uniref:uncharacterized protein LOC116159312 n=1 Tax=Photinus pyralis TaxID=7054 RepID=UPI001266F673|nr:uncharacterized protein LOC116159312 [Photinus pyralis]